MLYHPGTTKKRRARRIGRYVRIIRNQLRGSSFADAIGLFATAIYQNETLLIYCLKPKDLGAIASEGGENRLCVHKGTIDDLERNYSRFEHIPWEFQCHLFDGVSDFFVAESERNIQHISWIYYCDNPNRFIHLGPKDAEIKFCLTLPSYRGLGLYVAVLKSIVGFLSRRGFDHVYVCVNEENRPSIRGIERAGFSRVGETQILKICGIQFSRRYAPSQ